MKALRTLLGVTTAMIALVFSAGIADAAPSSSASCTDGTIASGTYSSITVSGTCAILDGAVVTVHGPVILLPNANLKAITASTVRVTGNILVGVNARLGLGCSYGMTLPPFPGGPVFCTGVSHDQVDGNIVADRPLTLIIDGITVNGNIVSNGGGRALTGPDASTCEERPGALNFPIKDNTINGNVVLAGWQGCWNGYIRNVQHGNAVIVNNRTSDPDSTEIVTNQITGNLVCSGNTPAPQVGDSEGLPNAVTGAKVGQCAGL